MKGPFFFLLVKALNSFESCFEKSSTSVSNEIPAQKISYYYCIPMHYCFLSGHLKYAAILSRIYLHICIQYKCLFQCCL